MEILTSRDVCRELKIPYHRLEYAFFNGLIPEVAKTSGGRRVYTEADVRRIAAIIHGRKRK